jgi:allantoicase
MNEAPIKAKPSSEADALARRYLNLAQPRLGAAVVYASDDFFAPKERLIDPRPPVFIADKYDDNGKWMDGWESRRKREPGHDAAIVRLGRRGRLRAVDIDTSHFTGNYPAAASLEGCLSEGDVSDEAATWRELVPRTELTGDSHHVIGITDDGVYTHLRLNIYPDGGVARLRVFGEVEVDWREEAAVGEIDLAALGLGARAVGWSDAHYGSPDNILAPGRGVDMGDGWETRRRRGPGNDWIVIALAHPGEITRVMVDTAHYKGNYPAACTLRAALVTGADDQSLEAESAAWPLLLPEQPLDPDAEHAFALAPPGPGPVSHVRLDIFPDGGVSRLRLIGRAVLGADRR